MLCVRVCCASSSKFCVPCEGGTIKLVDHHWLIHSWLTHTNMSSISDKHPLIGTTTITNGTLLGFAVELLFLW